MRAVRRGEDLLLPARDGNGGCVRERAMDEGIYFTVVGAPCGFFVDARRMWEELDKLID